MWQRFLVDWWFRHHEDPDQSVRISPQMMGHAGDADEVQREIAEMRAQGYNVQRVVMRTPCPDCGGHGRIGVRPKGVRKAKVLPAWRLTWRDCVRCGTEGYVFSTKVML